MIDKRRNTRMLATGFATVAVIAAVLLSTTPSMGASMGARHRLSKATPSAVKLVARRSGTRLSWRARTRAGFKVQQSTSPTFAKRTTYKTRGPLSSFAPYKAKAGKRYYFRVRARTHGRLSPASKAVTATISSRYSQLRVLTYNSLDASFDGDKHPGGVGAPFSKRLPKQLALLNRSKAAVIGIEEANSCLHTMPHAHCYRQIDALSAGLHAYRLANTTADDGDSSTQDYFAGNYILFNPAQVTPVGSGGNWSTGPTQPAADNRYDAYQEFRVKATGAEFLYVVVHDLATAGHAGDKIRGKQIATTITKTRAFAQAHGIGPTLIVGDFNSYRGEYKVHDYVGKNMRKAGLNDDVAIAQKRVNAKYDSINGMYRDPRKGHGSADHIYSTGQIGVKRWGELLHLKHGKFVGTFPSDHNPVYATVEIPYSTA
jgi:endonuclease/exonuclease/phosphatase family metal-dependent hydrolase